MATIGVVGAGIMGHGLALVFALAGHSVRITDSREEARGEALGLMASALETLREAGAVDAGWTRQKLEAAVQVCQNLEEAVAEAEIVVEAITENPDAKRALFSELDKLCAESTILASNTSYLDVFPMIPARRQRRSLIAHWYTPPYIVDLVDIVPGPETDPEVIETMRDWVLGLGQTPIVLKKFIAGYVANRIQSAITLEVMQLLDDNVATPREIDDAIIHGLSLRIPILGHLAKADFTGLDMSRRALANRSYKPPEPRGRAEILDKLVAEGRTGVMAGRGFFDWGERSPAELMRERDLRLLKLKAAMKDIGPLKGT
jgi:3-hydroxybutyryl-CoA dehydrogenase